jgi:hypothetical protein
MRFVLFIVLLAPPAASDSRQGPIVKVFNPVVNPLLNGAFDRADQVAPDVTTLATKAGSAANGQPAPVERSVIVCVDAGSGPSIFPSRSFASKMFARIGVTIHWRFGLHGCPAQAIVLGLTTRTPPGLKPGSLAYSLPYEGRHILVFYDRIVQDHPNLVKCVLAYVLVHEITHLLQAENRHSPSGIMKVQWAENDYEDMKRGALAFTADDIDLIYRGLAARARPKADAQGR